MKTEVHTVTPRPILVDPKPPGRWIWGPVEPITDMCVEVDGKRGNATVSWWNDENTCDSLADYCKIERPKNARVVCVFDGTEWKWIVRIPERRR